MPAYLADSSVLLDVLTADPTWAEWSVKHLEEALAEGSVFIDPVVYAEISIGFSRIEDLEAALAAGPVAPSPYRCRISLRGAHAEVSDLVLITRDPRR